MECVILAGGLGTRIQHLAPDLPKALIPVSGRPFVDHQLEWLATEGVERVVLSIGYRGELLKNHVGDGRRFGLLVSYVDEGRELRGTGGALRLAFDQGVLPEKFLVLYGDSYLLVPLRQMWELFCSDDTPGLMGVLRNGGRWDRSNVHYENGRVILYDKFGCDSQMEYIDYGISVLSRDLVQEIPSGVQFDLATLFHDVSVSGRLAGFEVHERFYEVGSPEGLVELEAHLASRGY